MPNYDDPRDHKGKQVAKFLEKMSMIESSGGKNLNHNRMPAGIHKDTAAIGEYGLMPQTAMEISNRAGGIPELEGMDKHQVEEYLKLNPEVAERLAQTMASRLLQKNDSESANYMWEMGHNRKPSKEKVEAHPRTRKFRVLSGKE